MRDRSGAILAAVAVVGALYVLLPSQLWVRVVLYDGVSAGCTAAAAVTAWRSPPGRRHWWATLTTGLALFVAGDVTYTLWHPITGTDIPFPSLSDALYIGSYPLLAAGLLLLHRARHAGRDLAAVLDAAIVTTGVAVVAWQLLVRELVVATDTTVLARAVSMAYPVADVALLAITARLALGGGSRTPAFRLLCLGLVTMTVTDLVYGVQVLRGAYAAGGMLDLGWIASYGCVAAAAVHPSAASIADRPPPPQRPGPLRLIGLAVAALAAPATAGAAVLGAADSALVPIGASAVLFLLVLARMAGLLRDLARSGERRFQSLVQRAADAIVVLDRDRHVTFASPSLVTTVGGEPAGSWLLDALHPRDAAHLGAAIGDAATGGRPASPVTARLRTAAGGWRRYEWAVTNLLGDPDVAGVVLNGRDVTERVQLEEELRRLAFHDPLTGLANRALFADRVGHALERARRDGSLVAVLFLDLDDFKTVNDSLGHAAGDRLLVQVAQRLTRALRASDTPARLGGDEFGVLLEQVAGEAAAREAAERLSAALRAAVEVDGRQVPLAVSAGVVVAAPGDDVTALLRDADTAMYAAKRAGKSRVEVFRPTMHENALRRLELLGELKQAIAERQLVVHYQPFVRLADGRAAGVEALVRWRHPTRGLVSPAEFIPLAEETGLILELGRHVLQEACAQGARWARSRGAEAPFVSVNVSARQLAAGGLLEEVEAVLAATGLPPSLLLLELTESCIVANPVAAGQVLRALKDLGVRLAVDDFGTGYSSLAYLQQLPLDVIKVDRSFVQSIGRGADGAVVARSILSLGAALGVETVAEGVEEPAQLAELVGAGCTYVQGFLYARPMAADDLDRWLDERRILQLADALAR